jgi:hypothetical protein
LLHQSGSFRRAKSWHQLAQWHFSPFLDVAQLPGQATCGWIGCCLELHQRAPIATWAGLAADESPHLIRRERH